MKTALGGAKAVGGQGAPECPADDICIGLAGYPEDVHGECLASGAKVVIPFCEVNHKATGRAVI
ncbi:MAG: hypothetical protein Q8J78_03095 [Moraxellaceae bacterium]|nr:hypothetical protein [Moraxellaceae bacterium]